MSPPCFQSYFPKICNLNVPLSSLFLKLSALSPLLLALLSFDPAIIVHKISLENTQSMLNKSSFPSH